MGVTEPGARSGRGAYRVIRVVADRRARRRVTATRHACAYSGSIIWRYGGRGGGAARRRRPLALDGAASRVEARRRLGAARWLRLLGGGGRSRARRSTRAGGRSRPHAVPRRARPRRRARGPTRRDSPHVRLARPQPGGARRTLRRPGLHAADDGAIARAGDERATVPEEVVYWLPGARALVPGDTLHRDDRRAHALPGVLVRRPRQPRRSLPAPSRRSSTYRSSAC